MHTVKQHCLRWAGWYHFGNYRLWKELHWQVFFLIFSIFKKFNLHNHKNRYVDILLSPKLDHLLSLSMFLSLFQTKYPPMYTHVHSIFFLGFQGVPGLKGTCSLFWDSTGISSQWNMFGKPLKGGILITCLQKLNWLLLEPQSSGFILSSDRSPK